MKLPRRFESLEKRTPFKCISEPRSTPRRGVLQPRSPAALVLRSRRPTLQVKQTPQSSLLASQRERSRENTFLLEEETALQKTSAETGPLKVESSQVTVAVRVRPFSSRYVTRFLSEANLLCVLVRVHAGWHCLFIDGASRFGGSMWIFLMIGYKTKKNHHILQMEVSPDISVLNV